MNNISNTGMLL